jgi:hypothetical protein
MCVYRSIPHQTAQAGLTVRNRIIDLISGYPTEEISARRVNAYLVLSAALGLMLVGSETEDDLSVDLVYLVWKLPAYRKRNVFA